MAEDLKNKSSIDQIRRRFDGDVDRFSNLETGQEAVVDAPLMMTLVAEAAMTCSPGAKNLLDIGCGAGNYTLRLLQHDNTLNCDLLDLSAPMLNRAMQRVSRFTNGSVRTYQGDIRRVQLPANHYDLIVASAVLHHLRDETDWQNTFKKLFTLCAPGGSIWIVDLVCHDAPAVEQIMRNSYQEYLEGIGGPSYRDKVLQIIEKEDSPQTLTYQIALLKQVGFRHIDVLHKNACYAAFGAVKPLNTQRLQP